MKHMVCEAQYRSKKVSGVHWTALQTEREDLYVSVVLFSVFYLPET